MQDENEEDNDEMSVKKCKHSRTCEHLSALVPAVEKEKCNTNGKL
jgi:hypothetical protein